MNFNQVMKSAEWTSFGLGAISVIFFEIFGLAWLVYLSLCFYAVAFILMALNESFFIYDSKKFSKEDWAKLFLVKNNVQKIENDEELKGFIKSLKFWSIFGLVVGIVFGILALIVIILY